MPCPGSKGIFTQFPFAPEFSPARQREISKAGVSCPVPRRASLFPTVMRPTAAVASLTTQTGATETSVERLTLPLSD